MLKVDILVLNYNGENLLREFLQSVVQAAKNSAHDCRVIVLDNQSVDGSEDFVNRTFQDVLFIKAKENKVYCSFNAAVAALESDVVILLNNDMKVEINFVDPILAPFISEKDVFFVATDGNRAIVENRWGILGASTNYKGSEAAQKVSGYSFSAGIGGFHRKKFVSLGGYDELYLPGIYEDVDLCYRGWKRGWKGFYSPESKQYHVGSASFKKRFNEKHLAKIAFRNSLLFTMKNISDPLLLAQATGLTLLRVFLYILTGKWHMAEGFFMAIKKTGEALKRRKHVRSDFKLTDPQIIKIINRNILNKSFKNSEAVKS